MTDKCIPSKVIKGNPSLPSLSHEIKRLIHKRNKFYKAYRRAGNTQLGEQYLFIRHQIRRSIKDSHEAYLDGMLDSDGKGNQTSGYMDSTKLFQFQKNSRTDRQGFPHWRRMISSILTQRTRPVYLMNSSSQYLLPCPQFLKKSFLLWTYRTLQTRRSLTLNWSQRIWKLQPQSCQIS